MNGQVAIIIDDTDSAIAVGQALCYFSSLLDGIRTVLHSRPVNCCSVVNSNVIIAVISADDDLRCVAYLGALWRLDANSL